jgi:HipA-like protein
MIRKGYVFTYDNNYYNDTSSKSISLTMLKTKKTYEYNALYSVIVTSKNCFNILK